MHKRMASSQKISSSGSRQGRAGVWSAFDLVKPFPPTPNPDSFIADIDAAIAATEHARATALLLSSSSQDQHHQQSDGNNNSSCDPRLADEAYKAACAALASGRHEAAVRSLRIAIASCPPDKPSALSKLRSLMAIAESQLQQKLNHHQQQ